MTLLILGLVIFLGTHSVRIVAEDWRMKQYARLGENTWKGLYSAVSLVGFVLLVIGYGQARQAGVELWSPPIGGRHLGMTLMWPSFVLLAAAYVPGTNIRRWARGHPMLLGSTLWALAHLLSNGRLADIVLFGAFLIWAVWDFRACRRRDIAAGRVIGEGNFARDGLAVVIGTVAWYAFAKWLHLWLFGVAPLG